MPKASNIASQISEFCPGDLVFSWSRRDLTLYNEEYNGALAPCFTTPGDTVFIVLCVKPEKGQVGGGRVCLLCPVNKRIGWIIPNVLMKASRP